MPIPSAPELVAPKQEKGGRKSCTFWTSRSTLNTLAGSVPEVRPTLTRERPERGGDHVKVTITVAE